MGYLLRKITKLSGFNPDSPSNVELVPKTRDDVRAMIESMEPNVKAQLSADWLARFQASTKTDPWVHGFSAVLRPSGVVVGTGGFKGRQPLGPWRLPMVSTPIIRVKVMRPKLLRLLSFTPFPSPKLMSSWLTRFRLHPPRKGSWPSVVSTVSVRSSILKMDWCGDLKNAGWPRAAATEVKIVPTTKRPVASNRDASVVSAPLKRDDWRTGPEIF